MKYVLKIMLLFIPVFYSLHIYTSTHQETGTPFNSFNTTLPTGWDRQIIYMQTSPQTNRGIATLCRQRFSIPKTATDVAQSWPSLYIDRVNQHVGMGCFAKQTINKHSFIREYTGKRISATESIEDFTYIAMVTSEIFVDAKNIGNESRYMNHSSTPNAINDRVQLPDGTVILVLIALKTIVAGEEIRWNYGSSYWKEQGKEPETEK